jgi:oligopeptide/dipeptide ABC transporter ATP-binding protein
LIHPPLGCRFHPRCPNVIDSCSRQKPERAEVAPGHWVRCFNPVR